MSKKSELERAKAVLTPEDFDKYRKWLALPFVARYPYLADIILLSGWLVCLVLIAIIIGGKP